MTPMRLIVVGLGARARTWLAVISDNPDVDIVGLCDPDPAARDRLAGQYPKAVMGAGLVDMIGVAADAVLLCTPPEGRAALVETCCRHGLAILAEKPLADDMATAETCVEMAESAGVPLIVGLNFRFLPVTQAMIRLFAEGTVGRPAFARFTYERWRDGTLPHLNKYPLTMDQPMLWEQSVHHFDLMRFVYGAEPVRVYARTFNPPWSMYRGDANVSAILDFDGGLCVNYQGTWQGNWDNLGFEWRTDCTEGVVVQQEMFGALRYARRDDRHLRDVPLEAHVQWITDAAALLASFVTTWRGSTPPQCTGRDHLRSLQMLEACILSSGRGEAVELAELPQLATRAEFPLQQRS
ncbi:MAG: gfo/Idh/MocA family oxidoreductase [Limimaricola sp.]|uniref:Gfo/Idh/MocA family protein n=1 Tax=Limimaricola sp. TaxID=2211665 RepID=UPI001D55C548|nr:Gfo/Idh/MocA family oxidoreductase [Limimaricola sp.]MBI1416814.1 gfo/Idh/MocA family oxidoreductase [Limimaricola sp.]